MAKRISARPLVFAFAIVTCLTLLRRAVESSLLIYLLFPGLALSLLITGPHGGSIAQEEIAPIVGFLINTFSYYLLCTAILAMSGHRRAKRVS